MEEEPKSVIKRPYGNTSYIKHNINIVNGKIVYNEKFKSFAEEENESLARAYKKMCKDKEQAKEDIAKIREEKKKRESEDKKNTKKYVASLQKKEASVKQNKKETSSSSRQTKKVNLFDDLKVSLEEKEILLEVINYSLKEREIKILKNYYGRNYDGINRVDNSKETRANASKVVTKLKTNLKEAIKVFKENKMKYRFYLLGFTKKIEYIDQNIFKNISKSVLKNAYKKLTVQEMRVCEDYFNEEKSLKLTDDEVIFFAEVIFEKIKVYVNAPQGINAYFNAFSIQEQKTLKDVISLLSNDDKLILKKKFGVKLDGNGKQPLTKQEYIYFRDRIYKKCLKKYQELMQCPTKTDYYLSLIKGFSNVAIEKNCNVADDIDKNILLDILERLNEIDKNTIFTTKELANMTRSQLNTKRELIYSYITKNMENLKKVYSNKNDYNILLDQVFNGNQIQKEKRVKHEENNQTISFENYLEKVTLNTLKDVINYALNDEEKEFISTLFEGNYKISVAIKKNETKKFNKINIKISSFINYIADLNEEEYQEFLNRLKDFPKDEDYNLYHIKDLKTYLDIPFDSNLKFILKNGLIKEERLLLQKRFGLIYEGIFAEKIDSKEKYSLINIKDKILKQYELLENCNEEDEQKKLEIILHISKENKVLKEKDYKYLSLIDYLAIKEEDLEKFYEIMTNIFNEEERTLIQKRFGPMYDGINATKVSLEDNSKIFSIFIPRVKNKLKPKKRVKLKSLIEFLELKESDKKILEMVISTVPSLEIELLKKAFGPSYDGKNSIKLSQSENAKLKQTVKPRILNAIKIIKETDEKDLERELNKLTSKNKFGYRYLSLYDLLGLSLSDKELLINTINKKFSSEQIILLQKRFGPLYDGVDIVGVTKEENVMILQSYVGILKYEINKEFGIKKEPKVKKEPKTSNYIIENYRIKSLFKYLNILDEEKDIILDIINILSEDDQKLFQKRFGPLYDGVETKPTTLDERTRIFKILMPKINEIFLTLKNTPKNEYSIVLRTWGYKFYKRKKDTKDLIRVMTVEEYEKEIKNFSPTLNKVVKMEKVQIKYQEKMTYFKNLVKILEEEKKEILKNYSYMLLGFKYSISLVYKKLKMYSLNLTSYGFTQEEAMFILINMCDGLNLSKNQVLSFIGVKEEELEGLYLDSINKIKTLLNNELDNYILLLKEMSDNNE